ncbi:hypothetical protein DICPUDRAFT_44318 [Dictyostelium purpureum]|uniref:BAG domain-containing protein n=1 Tax=Dictyostelium purpureum TaxID=5786 RepID=F1A5Z5_DICPU|nr:uncharacterized protein DICPUDRAFT_44318 [Dictyostelium purpureum]EGC28385.1 hypothetical protein DICPUDRAFT_44318 [Dictyostelium purpureum]|eukprot:XP_003295089.1 hypothetical protein DICPUDRAFT_44318 [Dictyostelium purpureum]
MSYNNRKTTTTTTTANLNNSISSDGSATANAQNLEKILEKIKECNYTLVNSITATEAIQKEKDALKEQLEKYGKIKDEKRIKKLQYNISLQTETLMKALFELDSLTIQGHIKHSHKIKKERKKEKKQQRQFEEDDDDLFDDSGRSRSGSNSTSNTSSSNFSESESDSGSSGSSSSETDSDEYLPKFGPHKLRKYRKQIVNRVMRLIEYLDTLSTETKEIKSKNDQVASKDQQTPDINDTEKPRLNAQSKSYQPQSFYQHKHQKKDDVPMSQNKPTIGSNRSNSYNNLHSQQQQPQQPYRHYNNNHSRQPSFEFDSPFEFKDFQIPDDNLHPFGEEEENNFDMDNFESPSSTLNRYRSNSNREGYNNRLFRW